MTKQLTPAQQKAIDIIAERGHVSDGGSVRLATVEILERLGLITLRKEWTCADFSGRAGKPINTRLEWIAELTAAGREHVVADALAEFADKRVSGASAGEFIHMAACAFLDQNTLVSWDGINDGLFRFTATDDDGNIVDVDDDAWEGDGFKILAVSTVEEVKSVVLSNAVTR